MKESTNKGIAKDYFDSIKKELVDHPAHYNKEGRKECWDEMLDIFGPEAVGIFDVLSAYKYYYRAGLKDGNPSEQDKAKIDVYMEHAKNMKDISIRRLHTTSAESLVVDSYWEMNDILENK